MQTGNVGHRARARNERKMKNKGDVITVSLSSSSATRHTPSSRVVARSITAGQQTNAEMKKRKYSALSFLFHPLFLSLTFLSLVDRTAPGLISLDARRVKSS